ncbi:MAG: hypothetical protein QXF75_05220 [Candidatus Bathyarchaeia archaeon]
MLSISVAAHSVFISLWRTQVAVTVGPSTQRFIVVLSEGWQNKELFVPIWHRLGEDPSKIALGISNKRDMWYHVRVYKKMADESWLEIVPDEFLKGSPYIGPWSEKTFVYSSKPGDEIKVEVRNDRIADPSLMALWFIDWITRATIGIRIPPKLPDYTNWDTLKSELSDFYNSVIKPFESDLEKWGWKKLILKTCELALKSKGLLSSILLDLGIEESLRVSIILRITRIVETGFFLINLIGNIPVWWDLFWNLFKSPFCENVIFTLNVKNSASTKSSINESRLETETTVSGLEIISGLTVIQSEPYYVGETINACFTIHNKNLEATTLHILTVRGYNLRGDVQDFTLKTNITINPNETYNYEGELTLLDAGSFHLFIAYQTTDGEWVTDVPTSSGAANSFNITALSPNVWIGAELCSPGELRAHDSEGRITGLVNNQRIVEIPHSFYLDNIVVIYSPNDSYKFQLKGISDGEYNLTISKSVSENLTLFEAIKIPISNNSLHQFTCDWDTLSINEEGVLIRVDSDGDNFFEGTFASDSKLTAKEFMFPAKATFTFNAFWEGVNYPVTIFSSNSSITNFNFDHSRKQISFQISGETGESGYCNVSIPKTLLKGEPWAVQVNGTNWSFSLSQNDTHSFIYFTFTYASTYQVAIQGTWVVPEFPSTVILTLCMLPILVLTILVRKKQKTKFLKSKK